MSAKAHAGDRLEGHIDFEICWSRLVLVLRDRRNPAERLRVIGSFRLLLAIFVVISHTKGFPFGRLPDPALSAIVGFFFLSGYLMPATLERNYVGETFSAQTARYLLNRFLRIFPVYWLALVLQGAALAWNAEARSLYDFSHPNSFLQNFVLLGLNQGEFWHQDQRFIGPAWTLDVELQYYLLVPFFVLCFRRGPRLSCAAMVAAAALGLLYLCNPTGRDSIDRSLLPWFPFFAAGYLSYWYREKIMAGVSIRSIRTAGSVAAIASLALLFVSPPASHWAFACALILFALALLHTSKRQRGLDRFLGNLSYPVFLLHAVVNASGIPAHLAAIVAPGSVPVLALCTLFLTLPVSIVTEFALSQPIDKIRGTLRRQAAPLMTGPTAHTVLQ